jgi:hypothetical protein
MTRRYNTLQVLKQSIEDQRYLQRLNCMMFTDLLFPNSIGDYAVDKWTLFREDLFAFMCSCSVDKLEILADYIDRCRRGDM